MTELVSLFERQVDYVKRQPDSKLYLALPRFVAFLRGEPRLAALLEELTSEYQEERERYGKADDAHVLEVTKLWELHAEWFSQAWDEVLEIGGRGAVTDHFGHPSELPNRIRVGRQLPYPGVSYEVESSRLEDVFRRMAGMWRPSVKREAIEERLHSSYDAFQLAYSDIVNRADSARQRREAIERTYPGAAWRRLTLVADAVCPPRTAQAPNAAKSDTKHNGELCVEGDEISKAALGRPSLFTSGGFNDPRPGILADGLEILREEVVRRIGLHLSHHALVMRFKTKCERFLGEELRAECAVASRKAEAVLTLAAAEYLFDQGLNPLFNSQIVNLRPDLFDSSLPHALYVEAKQYGGHGSPETLVKKAAWQVWDTWNELDAQHRVLEAFLVVFRLGGPLLVFEGPARFHGRTLHPILVDIAPTSAKGSRQKEPPVQIAIQDLLPRVENRVLSGPAKRRSGRKVK